MENRDWKTALSENMANLRKKNKITQAELGEKLSYSDKSISKWERGEGTPDLSVVIQLADIFGVSVDEILGRVQTKEDQKPKGLPIIRHAAVLITICSIVFLSALAVFVALNLFAPDVSNKWLCFLAALPVTFIVTGIMFIVWKNFAWAFGSLSIALWTSCLFLQQIASNLPAGIIYAVGGIIQLAALVVCGFIVMRKAR
ncbi:MAG: helix-turn-helix transcriptional regulator [Clostridia bacterium]|nr:helix-turn-helix transcriptional regulator [Clostridia bacterium]